jgi:hypothetical protein
MALAEADPQGAIELLRKLQEKNVVPHDGGQREILEDTTRYQIVCCGRRFGKLQPIRTTLPTPEGMTTMGALRQGDFVFGTNGKPTEVTGVFPQGIVPIFEVTFSDGSKTECGEEHLWTVRTRKPEYRRPWRTLTLREIMDRGIKTCEGNKFRVPSIQPVEHTKKEQPIDPYLMGLLLGDGGLTTGSVCFSTADEEILASVRAVAAVDIKHAMGYDYRLVTARGQKNPLKDALQELDLMGKYSYEKWVPDIYLYGSIEQRIAILQGLLDTDGWPDGHRKHHVGFCSSSKKLAEHVMQLCRSLGGIAYVREKPTTHRLAYDVRARLPEGIEPFRLARKAEKYSPSPETLDRAIVKIEQVEDAESVCISVAAKNQLYLTSDYVPTHNTVCGAKKALAKARKRNQMIWWVAPTYKIVKRGYREILRQLPDGMLSQPAPQDAAFDSGRSVILKFKNGSRMEFYSAERPEGMLGEGVDLAILDEAAVMAKGVWDQTIRPTLIDRQGQALMISTPRGRNWFYYEWLRGQKDDYPNYKSWRFPTSANPYLPADEIEEMKQSMPLVVFQQEVLAEFISSAGAVFRFDPEIVVDKVKPQGHVFVGIDLAKSHDFTVLSAARSDNMMPCGYDRFNAVAWATQRARIRGFVHKLHKAGAEAVTLVMDSTGVGDPIVEEIEADGYDVIPINFTKDKQHMVIQLSKDLEDGSVRLDKKEEIPEFENYSYKVTEAGKWTYSAPEGQFDDCVAAKMLQHWGIVQEGAPNITPIKADDKDSDESNEEDPNDWSDLLDDESVLDAIEEETEIVPDSYEELMSRPGAWNAREDF